MATKSRLAHVILEKYKKIERKKQTRQLEEKLKEMRKTHMELLELKNKEMALLRSQEELFHQKVHQEVIDLLDQDPSSFESVSANLVQAISKAKEDGATVRVEMLTHQLRLLIARAVELGILEYKK